MVDLFAGAGGLSVGLGRWFDPVAAVELDTDSCKTYANVHPDCQLFDADLAAVLAGSALADLKGEVAAVVGGPPCQPWSSGGLRRGPEDGRNCIPLFLQAVERLAPPVFLMENVPGLATGASRSHLDALVRDFEDLGFGVTWRLLRAVDYGVPQKRVRLVVVGSRVGPFRFPNPTHGPGRRWPHCPAKSVIGLAGFGEPNPAIVTYAKHPDLRPDPYDGHLFNGGGRPIELDGPAPTMLASMGGNKTPWVDTAGVVPEYHAHLVKGGLAREGLVPGARRITVAEVAAIQTFPKSMTFHGRRSSQYRQAGNAVPPKLAASVGRALRSLVEGE